MNETNGEKYGYICMTCGKTIHEGEFCGLEGQKRKTMNRAIDKITRLA